MAGPKFSDLFVSCADLLAGLEENRAEIPFLAADIDRLAGHLDGLRALENQKQQLQSALAEATHRRQDLASECLETHRRLARGQGVLRPAIRSASSVRAATDQTIAEVSHDQRGCDPWQQLAQHRGRSRNGDRVAIPL